MVYILGRLSKISLCVSSISSIVCNSFVLGCVLPLSSFLSSVHTSPLILFTARTPSLVRIDNTSFQKSTIPLAFLGTVHSMYDVLLGLFSSSLFNVLP